MSRFTDFVLEVLEPVHPVMARRMFGGYGLFRDGVMFALIAGGHLYFKVDAQSRPQFEAAGLQPFTYARQGKLVALSFHRAPERVFDEPDQARLWGTLALAAALRVKAAKPDKAVRAGRRLA